MEQINSYFEEEIVAEEMNIGRGIVFDELENNNVWRRPNSHLEHSTEHDLLRLAEQREFEDEGSNAEERDNARVLQFALKELKRSFEF
jgi:hypothetical protein